MEYKKIISSLESTLTPEKIVAYILKAAKESYDYVTKAIAAIPDDEMEHFLGSILIISKIRCYYSDAGLEVIFEDGISEEDHILLSDFKEKFEGKVFVEILPLEKAVDICYEGLNPVAPNIREIFKKLDFEYSLKEDFIREIPETADVIVSANFFEN